MKTKPQPTAHSMVTVRMTRGEFNGLPVEFRRKLLARAVDNALDAELLDWLDEVNAKINSHYNSVYGWRFDVNGNRACLDDCHIPALTVRKAISNAMRKEQA